MGNTVDVQFAVENRKNLPTKKQFSHWANNVLNGTVDEAKLTIRIVDETEGRELNEHWRKNKRGPTNVLSFPAGDNGFGDPDYLGDIVICAPVVLREAEEQGKSALAHWAHMVVHGILHLLGHDHESAIDADKMEAIEIEKLDTLGFDNPYN